MRILITATSGFGCEAGDYKSKLEDFKYEEIRDEYGDLLKTYVEINSLEDLAKLSEAVDKELIVDFRKSEFHSEPFIEIYDDWRE
jgi:hypothetical protein